MPPGVEAVPAVPGMTGIITVLMLAGMFALALLVRALFAESWRQGIASALALVAVVGVGIAYIAPRFDTWQEGYDYDATWASLEARYGVMLSEQDRSVTLPLPRGRHSTGIMNQHALGGVVMPDGTVRDDLYLQYVRADPLRLAIVTKPPGANSLVVTRGEPWWDEIPVSG